jgi:hypothetical protein
MHGLDLASRSPGVGTFTPRRRFSPTADHSVGTLPRIPSSRSSFLDAAFHSGAATASLSESHRNSINASSLHLRNRFWISISPFGLELPAQLGVARPLSSIHIHGPLPTPIQKRSVCYRTSAPLRDVSIPRAHCARPDSNRRNLPLRVARSAFTPRRVPELLSNPARRINAPAPLLPAWLAVPSNLLEPRPSCACALRGSREKWRFGVGLFVLESDGYGWVELCFL